jgi:NADPH-dependent F420 reductase
MQIAIIGGTGKEGAGLAVRWALAGHGVVIGSRDAGRARAKAAELSARTGSPAIAGEPNPAAARLGEVVVLALPWTGLDGTLPELREPCRGKIVISTVVPLTFGGPRLFTPPPDGSAAEAAQRLLGNEARVVAAFHHIAAHDLAEQRELDADLLLCGADEEARAVTAKLGDSLGLRAIDVGPLSNSGPLEGLTAILATINRRHKIKSAGIRITGL